MSSRALQKSMSESFKNNNESTVIESANKSKKSAEFSIQSEFSIHESSNDYLMMTRKYQDQQKAARVQILANEKNLAHAQVNIIIIIIIIILLQLRCMQSKTMTSA